MMGKKRLVRNRDKLRDALWLAELAEDAAEEIDTSPVEYSEKFCEGIVHCHEIANRNMKRHVKIGKRYYSKAAMIIGVIIASLLITGTVYAAYYYWVNFVLVDHGTHSSVEYALPQEAVLPTYLEEKYIPGYVPEGYVAEEMVWYDWDVTNMCVITYWDAAHKQNIVFNQSIISGTDGGIRYNTEGTNVRDVSVGVCQAKFIENEKLNFRVLVWTSDKYNFYIFADDVSAEELIHMAESIKLYSSTEEE